jgi:hypothetical protein
MAVSMRQARAEETAGMSDLEIEMVNAQRMLRVAGWSTIFCARTSFFSLFAKLTGPKWTTDLITTDILGPFNAPYAIANLGLVPGVILYFFFGERILCRVDYHVAALTRY